MILLKRNECPDAYIIVKAIMGWILFFFLYSILKNVSGMEAYSVYLPLIGEPSLDVIATILTFKISKKFASRAHKNVFILLSISFFASLLADFFYNLFLNLFNFRYENTIVIIFFDAPFALFLLLQLVIWAYIIFLNRNDLETIEKVFYVPNIILSLLMFIMFMFGIPWRIDYFSEIGLFQTIDTILEIAGFALATICLARSKNHLIRFLTIGYLIIVSSDFIIRYYVISGSIPYLSPFESTWVLGLLIICVGCYLHLSTKDSEVLQLLPVSSLQSQITIWSLILWLGSVLLFIASNYLFSDSNVYRQITKNFLSTLVPFSVLAIIGSSYLSTKFSSTLFKLENIINRFVENDSMSISDLRKQIEIVNNNSSTRVDEEFKIYEVKKLYNFIIDTINDLQVANRIKAEFLMNMSHDFRTPASGIYHMSRSIYRRINDPELKRLQKLIIDSSEQLMNLLDEVLDYSKVSSGKYELDINSFEIKSIINQVVLFVSAKAKAKMLSIDCQYSNSPISYKGDRLILHRIILNIVSNAIKFTHAGEISIYVDIEELNKRKWVVIKVKDTGIGIEEEYHKLIFEPFFRIESPETSKYSGVGLGLSNVLFMLKKMDGNITLESSLNKGAIFSIFLPI